MANIGLFVLKKKHSQSVNDICFLNDNILLFFKYVITKGSRQSCLRCLYFDRITYGMLMRMPTALSKIQTKLSIVRLDEITIVHIWQFQILLTQIRHAMCILYGIVRNRFRCIPRWFQFGGRCTLLQIRRRLTTNSNSELVHA